jgi:hypothetical protein
MLPERLVVKAPRVANLLRRLRRMTPAAQVRAIEANRVLLGGVMARLAPASPESLASVEFQVFSQFGEDGIVQYLITHVQDVPPTFIEFGVENYRESNTRFLLWHDNWRGLVIDGSAQYVREIRASEESWRFDLTSVDAFITAENINQLFREHGFTGEIGLLSIDIDGNDYWIWDAIDAVSPVIVVTEYNSVFGPHARVTVPYDPAFQRTRAHHSNLYFGASLAALRDLGERKGYVLVGCNSNGNNAFFVRADRLGEVAAAPPGAGYVESRFRESRDEHGNLTFVSGPDRLGVIAHLPVHDLSVGRTRTVREAVGEAGDER